MRLIVTSDAGTAARCAADEMIRACAAAIDARHVACIAVSGGRTPGQMLREFVRAPLPWASIIVAQVDERCVPAGDPRRNLGELQRVLVAEGPLPPTNLLAMPVDRADLEIAAEEYADTVLERVGPALAFDLVQLGLGEDGHTASLVPGDPVLGVTDRDVAVTQPYDGTRRMTLTYRVLQAARERLWLVTGAPKTKALAELLDGSGTTPAVRITRADSVVVADQAAAAGRAAVL
jgi:6-phosphogluconolactonase